MDVDTGYKAEEINICNNCRQYATICGTVASNSVLQGTQSLCATVTDELNNLNKKAVYRGSELPKTSLGLFSIFI